jgi:uncharacterized protein with PIN domain
MRADSEQEQFAARFRYFGTLPELLRRRYRQDPAFYPFKGHPGVKDAIETMGVPHTEVDVVLANDHSVGFDYQLQHDDLIDVYPLHTPVPIHPYRSLSAVTGMPVGFVIDLHLGKLARRLRLLGFDCLYRNDYEDSEILRIALDEERIILTRDLGILKHRQVSNGYLIRSGNVEVQVREVLDRYRLLGQIKPWRRCLNCNGLLRRVDKASVLHRLEPKTRLYYEDFHQCEACGRLYWQGSHFEKMVCWIDALLGQDLSAPRFDPFEYDPQ